MPSPKLPNGSDELLMQHHIAALYCTDEAGDMTCVNDWKKDQSAPELFIGETSHGVLWRYRQDVSKSIREEIDQILENYSPSSQANMRNSCQAIMGKSKVWLGPAYAIPDTTGLAESTHIVEGPSEAQLEKYLPEWMPDVGQEKPMVAWLEGQDAVGICSSVRASKHAMEAGIDVAAEFRRRHIGAAVVAAWAREVRALGLQPLYSTSNENLGSQALAKHLGCHHYGVDFHIG